MSRRANVLLFLAVLLLAAGCAKPRTVGKWNGAAQTSGRNISTSIEFKPDGTMTTVTKTPAGEVSTTATYTVAGDKLTIHASKVTTTTSAGTISGEMSKDQVATVNVQGDTLSFTRDGHTAQFTRTKE